MVERLDDAGARNELAEHRAGMLAAEIDRLDPVRSERILRVLRVGRARIEELDGIGRVDHDAALPWRQVDQRLLEIDPAQSHQHDLGARGVAYGPGLYERAKLADKS